MSVDKIYKCEYCGKVYSDPLSAAKCTIKCAEVKEDAEKAKKEAEIKARLEKLEGEIKATYQRLKSLINDYNESSGERKFNSTLTTSIEKMRNLNSLFSPEWDRLRESSVDSNKDKKDCALPFEDFLKDSFSENSQKKRELKKENKNNFIKKYAEEIDPNSIWGKMTAEEKELTNTIADILSEIGNLYK